MRLRNALLFLAALPACAQLASVPNELFPAFHDDMNTSLADGVSLSHAYSNPSWLMSLAASKITGLTATVPCGGSDDTAVVQAALSAGGTVTLSGATCAISSALTIPSNTTLFLNGVTLSRKAGTLIAAGDECFLTNASWVGGNSDIAIVGPGYMNCNGSTQTISNSGSGLGELFGAVGIRLNNVTRALVGNFTISPGTFAVQAGAFTYSTISNININNNFSHGNQDGIHVNGPASYVTVSNIIDQNSSDNIIALNADDLNGGEMTAGDIRNVVVSGGTFNLTASGQCIRLLANTHTIADIQISNITGTCGGNIGGITLGWNISGTESIGGIFQDIRFNNIQFSSGGPMIQLRAGAGSFGITAKQLYAATCCASPTILQILSTVSNVQIEDAYVYPFIGGLFADLVGVNGGTVDFLRLSGIYASNGIGAQPIGHLVNATGGAISNLAISDTFVNGASGSTPTTGGTIVRQSYQNTSWNGIAYPTNLPTSTNCSSAASPAVCVAAAAGSIVVAASATSVVVNTTAVTANSQIIVTYDSSLGAKLGVTCNATEPALYGVTARTAGTSFTLSSSAPSANPACFSYAVIN
jgi:hypothetical protein